MVILQILENEMKNIIRLISNKFNLIKPKKYEKNIFTIFSQRNSIIETADTETFDTESTIEVSKITLHF